jgi:hypothetical protein
MNAAKIREGFEYAISEVPRKGVTEDKLHTIGGTLRARVIAKGIERWAPNAKDSWGDPDGALRADGIKVEYLDRYTGQVYMNEVSNDSVTGLLKSRDFLMLWSEYQERRDRDDAEIQRKADEREALRVATQEKVQQSLARLGDIEGLELDLDFWLTGREDHYDGFRFTPAGMSKVLDHVSFMVYKILSEQE